MVVLVPRKKRELHTPSRLEASSGDQPLNSDDIFVSEMINDLGDAAERLTFIRKGIRDVAQGLWNGTLSAQKGALQLFNLLAHDNQIARTGASHEGDRETGGHG